MLTGSYEGSMMSKQLTLFGRVAKPESKTKSSVYVMPSNDYECYVERYYQRKGSFLMDLGFQLKEEPAYLDSDVCYCD